MVTQTMMRSKKEGACKLDSRKKEVIYVQPKQPDTSTRCERGRVTQGAGTWEGAADDVIDLGAPRLLRRAAPDQLRRPVATRPPYTPNPRLYPGPAATRKKPRRASGRSGSHKGPAGRARRRTFRRPVPNARLYRPAPRRPPPPPARPRAAWPPSRAPLDTASRAALQLSRARGPAAPPPAISSTGGSLPRSSAPPAAGCAPGAADTRRRLVVALPEMEPGARHSTSPEDCSDGNDSLSAPSEFLAEFLSAIMRRQYAEALKYCRLILQYEPHNATARGFYPLLQHKLRAQHNGEARGSSTDSSGRSPSISSSHSHSHSRSPQDAQHESGGTEESAGVRLKAAGGATDEAGAGAGAGPPGEWGPSSWEGSDASQSSLELDSCSGSGSSSSSPGPRASPPPPPPAPAPAPRSPAHLPPDANGNRPAHTLLQDDLDNDNDMPTSIKTDSTLKRLRAQFTCSIK